jgi:hypothetical protein
MAARWFTFYSNCVAFLAVEQARSKAVADLKSSTRNDVAPLTLAPQYCPRCVNMCSAEVR